MKQYFLNLGYAFSHLVCVLFGGPLHYSLCAWLYSKILRDLFPPHLMLIKSLINSVYRDKHHCHRAWRYCLSIKTRADAWSRENGGYQD